MMSHLAIKLGLRQVETCLSLLFKHPLGVNSYFRHLNTSTNPINLSRCEEGYVVVAAQSGNEDGGGDGKKGLPPPIFPANVKSECHTSDIFTDL